MRFFLVPILALRLSSAIAGATISDAVEPSATCLSYEHQLVTLSGAVFSRIYFGPPGYGETPKQDAREHATLLLLDAPICVKEDPQLYSQFEGNVVLVQLAAVSIDPHVLEKGQGHRATVQGTLYHSETGHHRTAVLVDVHSLTVP